MKLVHISFLLILPLSVLSQETNRFVIADTVIDLNYYFKQEFDEEMVDHIDSMRKRGSRLRFGIFQVENLLHQDSIDYYQEEEKLPTMVRCAIGLNIVEIANGFGFIAQAGTANVIQIDLKDSSYYSAVFYYTDGGKTHKFKEEEEFFEDISVPLEDSQLELSPDSEFKAHGIIKGRLIGSTTKFLEEDLSPKGFKEVQLKVESIFECKLKDREDYMKAKLKAEKEKKKKK